MYCVIMGDIINSRELNDDIRQQATRAAQAAFDRINTDYMGSLVAEFGMVRGDAFEGVLLTQSYAPKIVQDIIKAIYAVEKTTVRISVVLGELSVTGGDRNTTDGPAFHRALDRLAEIKEKKSNHWLQVHFEVGDLAQALVDGHMALLTALTEDWTDKQRDIVWAMEKHEGYQKIVAEKLKNTTTVVSRQLKAANYEAYRLAWGGLTEYLEKMDEYVTKNRPVIDKSHVPYFNVAKRRLEQHEFKSALKPAEKALEKAKQRSDTDEEQYIVIYNLLAEVYTNTKKYAEAEDCIVEALRIQEKMPKARLQYIKTLGVKGHLCNSMFSYENAKKYTKEALVIARNVLDEKYPYMGVLYNNLALSHCNLSEYNMAMECYKKSLSVIDKENDPIKYAIALNNIAHCYYFMGKLSEAIDYLKKALLLYEENLPPKHDYVINSKFGLSKIISEQEATV